MALQVGVGLGRAPHDARLVRATGRSRRTTRASGRSRRRGSGVSRSRRATTGGTPAARRTSVGNRTAPRRIVSGVVALLVDVGREQRPQRRRIDRGPRRLPASAARSSASRRRPRPATPRAPAPPTARTQPGTGPRRPRRRARSCVLLHAAMLARPCGSAPCRCSRGSCTTASRSTPPTRAGPCWRWTRCCARATPTPGPLLVTVADYAAMVGADVGRRLPPRAGAQGPGRGPDGRASTWCSGPGSQRPASRYAE